MGVYVCVFGTNTYILLNFIDVDMFIRIFIAY